MFLLDTNVCLDFLLKRSDRVIDSMRAHFGFLSVSAITVAELRVGARGSTNPVEDDRLIDLFLAGVSARAFDEAAATAYGDMVRRVGVRRGSFDRLIAAHALALNATLVTNNTRDFTGIPGLAVENWTQ